MNAKKAAQVLRSGHNPIEIFRALDYFERNNVAGAVEILLDYRTRFIVELMEDYEDNPEKYKIFGAFSWGKIHTASAMLTACFSRQLGRGESHPCGHTQTTNEYIASEYYDISVAKYLFRKRHKEDTWDFIENQRYEEKNIGAYTLKELVVVGVLERLLPFKEKIKSISITNARFEQLPEIIDEYYSHLDFIKLTDCVFPEGFQHSKAIVEYSEGASPIPQPNSLNGNWFSYLDKLFKQLKRLSTNESIEINAPAREQVVLNYKASKNGERCVTLEESNDIPESIVEFYEWVKPLKFSWKRIGENANSFIFGNAHFEPYNTKLLYLEEWKKEAQFGVRRGWKIDEELLDYQKSTFYIIQNVKKEEEYEKENIGYFGGKDSKGMIYYQKGMDFYSMGLDFDGYMYFLSKTYGLDDWQSVILALSQEDETYDYHSFESAMKTINPDFNLWEFKLSYQKARIVD